MAFLQSWINPEKNCIAEEELRCSNQHYLPIFLILKLYFVDKKVGHVYHFVLVMWKLYLYSLYTSWMGRNLELVWYPAHRKTLNAWARNIMRFFFFLPCFKKIIQNWIKSFSCMRWKTELKLDMISPVFSLNTWKAETRISLWVQDMSRLHSETLSQLVNGWMNRWIFWNLRSGIKDLISFTMLCNFYLKVTNNILNCFPFPFRFFLGYGLVMLPRLA